MKKLYTKLAGSDLKFSRFSFVKVLSLATAATFLSNVTPVFSANPDFRNTFLEGVKSAGVSYLQSILSVAGLNNSEDYANFLTKTLTGVSDYSPIVNVLPEASDSIRSIDMNAGSKKITRADLTPRVVKGDQITSKQDLGNPLVYGERAQGEAHDAIVFGQVAQTKADQGIAIGLTALAGSSRNTKNSIAIGSSLTDSYDEKERTVSFGDFSIAFGSKAHSYANEAIAMGYNAYAKEQALQGVAIGASSNVTVTGGVALGSGSISDRAAGVLGYTSMLQGPAINTKAQWKSTQGAVSVGNPSKGITRQIIGVAAGSEPTDAVNVVQLKDLESVVRNGGWKLSVGGKDDTTVIMDSAVDFSAGSTNLQISKGKDNNNIKFDLAKDIAVNKVTAGSSALDATGLVISGGPKIIISGIDAGGKKITGVSDGTGANDAVNFSQLSKISESLSSTARNLETAMANTSKYFGGGAGYDKEGKWKAPDFKIKQFGEDGTSFDKNYQNVADALAGVGSSITNVQNKLTEQVNNVITKVESESFVQQDKTTSRLTIGAKVGGAEINIANESGGDRIISGVGEAKNNNDAVNKGQLDESLEKLSTSLQSDDSAVIHYDKKEGDNNTINYASVTLGKGKGSAAVALHNVADGQISKGSRDAITGGQINKIGEDVAKFLGGEAEFKDGAFKGPTYNLSSIDKGGEVTDKSHSDVGSAFKGLDENIKNVNARIKEVSEGVAQDSLSWSDGDKAFVALHGEGDDRKASKITSLAAGSIVSGSSDAVNGGQIYDLNQSLAKYFGGDAKYDGDGWVLPGFKIMTFQEDGSFVEEDYDSIAAAFSGVNKVFKNLHNEISDNIEQNALLWSDDAGAFVAQHEEEGKKENSKITFLAKGKISEDSTDAINGGQIYTLQQTFASYFGGGSGYDKEGNWQGPKFYVQVFNKDGTKGDKEERNSVSEAFDVVNDSMSNINDRIKEVEKDTSSNSLNWNKEKGSYDASHVDSQGVKSPSKIINVANGKVDRDSKEAVNGGQLWETQQMITDQVKDIENKVTEGSVQYDKDKKTGKKTNKVTLVGVDDSSPVLIDNVADGKIKKDSKEAVNGGQLKDKMDFVLESANKYTDEQISHLVKDGVSGANSYTDMKVSTLSYVVEDVRKEARQAAAVGLAVSSLRYSDIPGKLTIAFGSGLWRSQSAFAFGTGYTSENGYIGSNLSITTSGGHWGISAGVNVILN